MSFAKGFVWAALFVNSAIVGWRVWAHYSGEMRWSWLVVLNVLAAISSAVLLAKGRW